MTKPINLLIIILFAVLILLVVLHLLFRISPQTPIQSLPIPFLKITPSFYPSPTIKPPFKVRSTNILDENLPAGELILVNFNDDLALKNIYIIISPEENINLSIDSTGKSLVIAPKNSWRINTKYFLKILQNSTSKEGVPLDQEYNFTFKTPPYIGI